ncbi:uncharacterized protein LOC131606051 [Vicia villosa]|uniref:uncharacterized protein LOC131606051 n=1 Tax=Vicia villosa TaxID=3911 RepID=UPI00273B412C|nr:uncharacterized protein LOC131606051 [Vicia villosa]
MDSIRNSLRAHGRIFAANCALFTLIPKTPEAKSMKDMRPIACFTTVIQDNILMAQELLRRYSRKQVSPKCAIQMDIQKAYDTLEWYAINGQVTNMLTAKRGLRQGDPISPLLFVLVIEYMHRCLKNLEQRTEFKYHPRCKKLGITNVSFADDVMLFTRGDKSSVHLILQEISFAEGKIPFKYLGVPLDSKKLSAQYFRPLIDKIMARITHWSARLLSYAGRCQRINNTLFAISAYWMQVFYFPKKVIKQIEALCQNYLWSGTMMSKKAPIAWESVCLPKSAGGLNIISLQVWNKAIMGKLLWNIHKKADKLWIRWLDIYFFKNQDVMQWQVKQSSSWMVRKLCSLRDTMKNTPYWEQAEVSDKFKTSDMYKAIMGDVNHVEWKKMIVDNYARPRTIFALWMTLKGRLPTKDRLCKFGILTENRCCFCQGEESIEHLFFACDETKKIWKTVLEWLHIDRNPRGWKEESMWLISETRKKGWKRKILKVAITETIYEVWKGRNHMVFNQTMLDPHMKERIIENIGIRCGLHRSLSIHIRENRVD